jgi:hypothetical protein
MTVLLKTRIVRKRTVRLKLIPKFPANVTGTIAITVDKANGAYTIRPDYSGLVELTTFDPTQELVLVYGRDGTWSIVPVSTLVNNPSAGTQTVTSGASAVVLPNTTLLVVNKTVGSATALSLPLSSLKIGPVRIVDFKGDAGTNNITVSASGSDKFNGNLTSWVIANDCASILMTPIAGVGYAVS